MSTGISSNARPRQLDALTSLRFFAAFAVVLYHVPYTLARSVGWTILPDGPLGVSFFFILSGFILRHVYQAGSFDRKWFYRKRFARIYPLHLVTLVIWIALFFQSWGNPLGEKINSGITNILLLQAFFSGPLFTLGYNAVSWSISVEAFFYALFPFLVKRRAYAIVFGIYAVIFLLMPASLHDWLNRAFPNFFYFNPLARLLEFSFGMVLYDGFGRLRPPVAVNTILQLISIVALLALIVVTWALPDSLRNFVLLFPFGALILTMSVDGWISQKLMHPVLVMLGESSFALYMIHHFLFRIIDDLPFSGPKIVVLCVSVLAAITLSIGVHYGIERPARVLLSERGDRPRPPARPLGTGTVGF